MANPYTQPSISGFNSSPPPDDGTSVGANEAQWQGHVIDKVGDPLKTFATDIDTNVLAAFLKVPFSAVTALSTDYTTVAGDRGKMLSVTGTTTITLLAAATSGSGYTIGILNSGTAIVTIDGNSAEKINGSATIALQPGDAAVIVTDGSNWFGSITSSRVLTTRGDLLTRDGSVPSRLAVGAANTVVKSDGTDPSWAKIVAANITAATITATELAANAVAQSELKTTTQTLTTASISLGIFADMLFTSAGRFSFNPSYWTASGSFLKSVSNLETTNSDPAYHNERVQKGDTVDTISGKIQYIQASPPWDLGDGEIPLFVWARLKNGKLHGLSVAPDAPWNYALYHKEKVNPADPQAALAHLRKCTDHKIKRTLAEKNALAHLCPHPWAHQDDNDGCQIVLFDPVSPIMDDLLLWHEEADTSVNELIEKGYLKFDNTKLKRSCPPGVISTTLRWK